MKGKLKNPSLTRRMLSLLGRAAVSRRLRPGRVDCLLRDGRECGGVSVKSAAANAHVTPYANNESKILRFSRPDGYEARVRTELKRHAYCKVLALVSQ